MKRARMLSTLAARSGVIGNARSIARAPLATRLSPTVTLTSPSLSAASSLFRRSLFIQTQTTPNHNALRFLPGMPVSPDNSYDFNSYRSASAVSPLAATLFGIEGVVSVYLGADSISVNIQDGADWAIIKPEVFAVIMDHYSSGKPIVYSAEELAKNGEEGEQSSAAKSTTILPTDSEIVAMIKELIETRIRPAVQEDGGDIEYISFNEATGKVLVQMQGSCKGCSSSSITLKNGIENMLMHYVPEVKCVEEYKDEAVESVSDEALKKLEDKLAQSASEATASA